MEKQRELFQKAKSLMKYFDPTMESILYHNICFLKMSDRYVYETDEDVEELVDFMNVNLN